MELNIMVSLISDLDIHMSIPDDLFLEVLLSETNLNLRGEVCLLPQKEKYHLKD